MVLKIAEMYFHLGKRRPQNVLWAKLGIQQGSQLGSIAMELNNNFYKMYFIKPKDPIIIENGSVIKKWAITFLKQWRSLQYFSFSLKNSKVHLDFLDL